MELDELDRRAYAMQVLPAGLSPPERYYFLTMRALYAMFATGRLTGEQARQEKRAVLEAYRQLDLQYRVGQQELRVLWEVQQRGDYYRKNGCSVCRQLASQLCGLNPSILKGSLNEKASPERGGGPAKLVEGVLRETPYIISPPEISTT